MKNGSFIDHDGCRAEVRGEAQDHLHAKAVKVKVAGEAEFDVESWREFVAQVESAIEKEAR